MDVAQRQLCQGVAIVPYPLHSLVDAGLERDAILPAELAPELARTWKSDDLQSFTQVRRNLRPSNSLRNGKSSQRVMRTSKGDDRSSRVALEQMAADHRAEQLLVIGVDEYGRFHVSKSLCAVLYPTRSDQARPLLR